MVEEGGKGFRRVVPSPRPLRIVEEATIRGLVDSGVVVIAVGGGGIPVVRDGQNQLKGVAAVIDKDLASALLSRQLDAEMFVMLTDVANVYADFGTPQQRAIKAAHPDALKQLDFVAGSMGPKIVSACQFVRETGKQGAIGKLSDLTGIMSGEAGTLISNDIRGIVFGE